ncbi:TfuA domain-containing protein [Streptomyces sp. NPDC005574]|uniref:TfuA domain-containing protein n=1 Tax=Streptomyces sp. NPDC005574 TaxID=3156891 RepID=UPI0033AA155A
MEILPPVAGGDLPRLQAKAGDTVAIIDGYFQRRPSVRHKEILDLLARGVAVHGAASMGALRAAELHAFGMTGHGRVFAGYHSGLISADDEVALLHGTEGDDYQAYTEALVNARFALMDAAATRVIPRDLAERFIAVAGKLPFMERTLDKLLSVAADCDAETEHQLAITGILHSLPNVKQADALGLLEHLTRTEASTVPERLRPKATWQLSLTSFLASWRTSGMGVQEPGVGWVADSEVHRMSQVLAADYAAWREGVALRALAADYHSSAPNPVLAQPTTVHDLEMAAVRRLQVLGLVSDSAVVDGFDQWCTQIERNLPDVSRICKAASRALFPHSTLAWGDPFLQELRVTGAYAPLRNHLVESRRFHRQIESKRLSLKVDMLRPDKILAHFGQRWNRSDLDDAVLERGFATTDDFITHARPYYLYDKFHPHAPIRCLPQGPN